MIVSATLPSLFSTALSELELAYIDEGAGRDGMPSLDQWANLLRALDAAGTDLRELPTLVRLSKRAVRSRVLSAARQGWVEQLKSGRGHTAVRLTVRGSEVAARWRLLQDAAEQRWRAKIGSDLIGMLRASLEEVVTMLPLEHPHYPATYGAADASITGGNGQDWKGVPRQRGDIVSCLPLSALVSEALVAFAVNYEESSPVPLSLSTAVIKRIPLEGRPVHEIGYSAGISALDRHGFVRVSRSAGREVVYLTPKGVAVSDAYDERIRAVEREWCSRFGHEPVHKLRRALEEVAMNCARSADSWGGENLCLASSPSWPA